MKSLSVLLLMLAAMCSSHAQAQDLEPVQYNHPGLTVDLGVGLWAWPLPMDWDGDGDYDMLVSCPDKPYNGTYFFENTSGQQKLPVFKAAVRVGAGMKNVQVSHVDGEPRVLDSSTEYVDFLGRGFSPERQQIVLKDNKIHQGKGNQRFNVWSYVDYDGDDAVDVMVGADDWGYYGWDDGYDAQGTWKRGPLHGYVYILRNAGTTAEPQYEKAFRLQAAGQDINVYGNPMPNLADFDNDGDLDLLCAEFLDGFTYFQNVGSRQQPRFAAGQTLTSNGQKLHLHVQMITPTAIDWDRDGDVDVVCGDEDGRVALIENTGQTQQGLPQFREPQYFQQEATDLKFGALVTPVSFDWDGDGDEDLVCGNTSGNIAWFENLDGGAPPRWSAPQLLQAEGQPIHIQAGPNGSIQGSAEAKWGYTTLSVADWDHDQLPDVIVNSIWGKIEWFKNIGSRQKPQLAAAQPISVAWKDTPPKPTWTWWQPQAGELVTQWRTTPVVVDWNEDGLNDLIVLDHEGYLSFFERQRQADQLVLLPGRRAFYGAHYSNKHKSVPASDKWLRLNTDSNGGSGRRKLCIVDWDGDGRRDIIVNSANAHWLRNVSEQETDHWTFEDQGPMAERVLAGHTTSPTTVDWDGDGTRALLLGAEDGRLYHLPRRSYPLTIDLDGQTQGQVVVDREAGQYLGHPTTCLLEDGRTMLCVYPKGHGKGGIVYKRSSDGGQTWSERLPTPANWATSREVPTLHRVVGPDGTKRIIMWSGLYPARLAVSEDDGAEWSELKPAGDWGGIVVMGFVEPLTTGPGHYLAMFHDDGRYFEKQASADRQFTLYKTVSKDGGLTWAQPEAVFQSSQIHLCEPGCIRSPDGKRLAVLLRENARRKNSHIIFSDDEGQTWTSPRELPLALTGDRHTGKYAPDGRLFISFRCRSPQSEVDARPFEGDWIGWVGTWDDLVNGRPGQYSVRLKDNHKAYDTAYPGVEVLPDGTFVTTTYGHWQADAEPYILSVRFRLQELDALAAAKK